MTELNFETGVNGESRVRIRILTLLSPLTPVCTYFDGRLFEVADCSAVKPLIPLQTSDSRSTSIL